MKALSIIKARLERVEHEATHWNARADEALARDAFAECSAARDNYEIAVARANELRALMLEVQPVA